MNSKSDRLKTWLARWGSYAAALFFLAALQTMPGFLTIGRAKPLFILPLCMAVAMFENEADAAFFGALGGLLWDFTSGRLAGLFAIALLAACFAASLLVQMYFRMAPMSFTVVTVIAALVVCSMDFLFNYAMPGYENQGQEFFAVILPTVIFSAVVSPLMFLFVRWIAGRFVLDN